MSYGTEGEFPSVLGGQGLSKGRQGRGERGGWLEAWNNEAGAWGGSLRAWGLGPGQGGGGDGRDGRTFGCLFVRTFIQTDGRTFPILF